MSEIDSARVAARLDRLPPSRRIWTIVLLISLGGVFEFYDLFFTGYVAPGMIKSGLFTPESLGFFAQLDSIKIAGFGTFVFSTFAGLWLGVVALGHLPDRFGRLPVFTWSLIWYVTCTAIMAFQRTGEMLNIWRFIAGLGFAVQLVTIDTYISELIPGAERGRAFAVNQFIMFCVVPVVALLAWLLVPASPLGLDGWRWVVLIGSIGAAVVWLLVRKLPESPRWLALQGRLGEAEAIMSALEREVTIETGKQLSEPKPVAPREITSGTFREIFSATYRTRTLMLSVFNMAQVIDHDERLRRSYAGVWNDPDFTLRPGNQVAIHWRVARHIRSREDRRSVSPRDVITCTGQSCFARNGDLGIGERLRSNRQSHRRRAACVGENPHAGLAGLAEQDAITDNGSD